MIRTEYEQIERTPSTIKKKAIYKSDNLGTDHSFKGIANNYENYRFSEHIDILRDEFECLSISNITFYIYFEINEKMFFYRLFCAGLEITNREDFDYSTFRINDEENVEELVNKLLSENLYDEVFIKAEMETKFYLNMSLDIENQYEREELVEIYDEGDDDISYAATSLIPIIETPFVSDNCSVCLTAKPSILLFPCLHLSVCFQCEEVGKLTNCPTCREKIERKIKI